MLGPSAFAWICSFHPAVGSVKKVLTLVTWARFHRVKKGSSILCAAGSNGLQFAVSSSYMFVANDCWEVRGGRLAEYLQQEAGWTAFVKDDLPSCFCLMWPMDSWLDISSHWVLIIRLTFSFMNLSGVGHKWADLAKFHLTASYYFTSTHTHTHSMHRVTNVCPCMVPLSVDPSIVAPNVKLKLNRLNLLNTSPPSAQGAYAAVIAAKLATPWFPLRWEGLWFPPSLCHTDWRSVWQVEIKWRKLWMKICQSGSLAVGCELWRQEPTALCQMFIKGPD